jgi:hypothetical protein
MSNKGTPVDALLRFAGFLPAPVVGLNSEKS